MVMKLLLGGPGTWSGLLLRLGQCAFGASSIALMVISPGFSGYTAFFNLTTFMGVQVFWSFGQAYLDIYALRRKRELRDSHILTPCVAIDWVLATLSLAAACSAAGVVVLFTRDLDYCIIHKKLPCNMFQISVAMAFISWILTTISSHVMFWILASV